MHLSRYIHLNPVRARLVQMAHEWVHSSYSVYIGLRPNAALRPEMILSYFANATAYRAFVEKYAEGDSAWVVRFLPS